MFIFSARNNKDVHYLYKSILNEEVKSFPLALKKEINGSTDISITVDLEELVFRCQDLGLEVMEISLLDNQF